MFPQSASQACARRKPCTRRRRTRTSCRPRLVQAPAVRAGVRPAPWAIRTVGPAPLKAKAHTGARTSPAPSRPCPFGCRKIRRPGRSPRWSRRQPGRSWAATLRNTQPGWPRPASVRESRQSTRASCAPPACGQPSPRRAPSRCPGSKEVPASARSRQWPVSARPRVNAADSTSPDATTRCTAHPGRAPPATALRSPHRRRVVRLQRQTTAASDGAAPVPAARVYRPG